MSQRSPATSDNSTLPPAPTQLIGKTLRPFPGHVDTQLTDHYGATLLDICVSAYADHREHRARINTELDHT